MDQYFLVLLGTGLNNEKLDHGFNVELQKGFDIVTDQILRARKENNCQNEESYPEDPLLTFIQSRHQIYFALSCSQQLQLELQEMDPDGKSHDILNNSDWLPAADDDDVLLQIQSIIKQLVSRQDNNNGVQDQKHSAVKNRDTPSDDDDDDYNNDDDTADHIHHLADLLPIKEGAVINVYWILPDQHNLNTTNTLPLFGALKRLQHCNNALLNILTTNNLSSDGFLDLWKKWLNFNVLDMTNPFVLKEVPLWHGSLTCVGLQRKSRVILPGFTLTSDSNTQRELDVIFKEGNSFCPRSTCSTQYLKPEIQILRYIPWISVPLYLLLPIKLKLHLEYKNEKLSQTFLHDLHSSCSKGLGLLACMSLTTKSEAEKTGQNLESWMEYITSSSDLSTSPEKLKAEEKGISSQELQQILSLPTCDISLPQKKSLHLTKKIEIDLSSTIEHNLQSDLNVPPSKWPERLWLMQNDPAELAAREAKKKAPIPIEEVLSMDVKDILKRFHSDGRPVRENLSPLRSAYKTDAESHILINTTEESIRRAGYPEALTKKYHGVEYCLDSRDALSKDIQIAGTQTSILKQETLSSYAALNSKRLETIPRNFQRVTRSKDRDRSIEAATDVKKNTQKRPKKRTSPSAKDGTTRHSTKRKRSESPKQQGPVEEKVGPTKTKESRSQRHKRRLRLVIEKTLIERGIDKNNDLYSSCSERLYSLIKSFLKDLTSSHGLNDTMKDLARSNVDQVINFEKTRLSVK
ncbi:uncharacterized protein LOC116306162 [Actinia tenebrosa]|uniref:Uncharacterized protein LOC116306162 n=1 Tax=Actinia tenebrosa TaxID=6105 RepID=A0A6P8IXF1_ACTTE|nr:uncharacterized protein LOC116306162 [Actinia tenebrosa]